jgi:rfaE bifunctional protein nucleotidyltransferase chain/domain
LNRQARLALAPLLAEDELGAWADAQRAAHRSIVFTNGCFDLLHAGHLHSLRFCAEQGDVLIVAINDDASVRQLKGAGRPVLDATTRALHLRSLRAVDAVTIFADRSVLSTILRVKPDVLAKGGEYDEAAIVGSSEMAGWGGRVVRIPMLPGSSTTAILQRVCGGLSPDAPRAKGKP